MFQKDQRKTPSVPGYNLHLLMKSFLGMGVYFLFIKQNTSMIHLTQGTAHGLVPEVMCGGECCLLPVNAAYDAVLVNAALGLAPPPTTSLIRSRIIKGHQLAQLILLGLSSLVFSVTG